MLQPLFPLHFTQRYFYWFCVSGVLLMLFCPPHFMSKAIANTQNFVKEPNTGIKFPQETPFNDRAYELVYFDTINTKIMGIGTYVAAIGFYQEKGTYNKSTPGFDQLVKSAVPKLLVFGFVRKVTAATLAESWGNALREYIADPTKADIKRDIAILEQGLEDVQRGSFIQLVWLPDGSLEMLIGKKTKAKINNPTVAEAFWAIHHQKPMVLKKPT